MSNIDGRAPDDILAARRADYERAALPRRVQVYSIAYSSRTCALKTRSAGYDDGRFRHAPMRHYHAEDVSRRAKSTRTIRRRSRDEMRRPALRRRLYYWPVETRISTIASRGH